jgi:hypothetical protein
VIRAADAVACTEDPRLAATRGWTLIDFPSPEGYVAAAAIACEELCPLLFFHQVDLDQLTGVVDINERAKSFYVKYLKE